MPADVPRTGPNTRPGEKAPVMPELATEHSAAGVRAFAEFFIKTIDWGYATTSSAYMRHYFTKTCIECLNAARFLDNARMHKQHYLGGRIVIRSISGPIPGKIHDAAVSVPMQLDISSYEVVDRTGRVGNAGPANINYEENVSLAEQPSGWRVVWLIGQ
jgi:hypothetical protein